MKRNDEIQVCGNCVFWKLNSFTHNLGDCRKKAPTGKRESIWPHTNIWEWCGNWEKSETDDVLDKFVTWFPGRLRNGNVLFGDIHLYGDLMEKENK